MKGARLDFVIESDLMNLYIRKKQSPRVWFFSIGKTTSRSNGAALSIRPREPFGIDWQAAKTCSKPVHETVAVLRLHSIGYVFLRQTYQFHRAWRF